MKVLVSKLASKMEELRLSEIDELKNHVSAEWGNQIRSYVLQPYTMVKDTRTNFETADVTGVLEGNLDDLVWEFLGLANKPSSR
jgi:peptide chain release factor 2